MGIDTKNILLQEHTVVVSYEADGRSLSEGKGVPLGTLAKAS